MQTPVEHNSIVEDGRTTEFSTFYILSFPSGYPTGWRAQAASMSAIFSYSSLSGVL